MIAVEQTQFHSNKDMINNARVVKALGHPIRLRILMILNRNECNVKHLWECIGIEQASISQHLAVLRKRAIINSSRRGAEMRYAIANPLAQKIITALTQN